jgi:plasmid stabilization system protein ParE
MTVRVLTEARLELLAAVEHYEREQKGLGRRLWDELAEHLAWIARNPEVAKLRAGGYRRVNLRVFPYFVAYVNRGDTVWVLAIGHVRRRPEYWIKRLR